MTLDMIYLYQNWGLSADIPVFESSCFKPEHWGRLYTMGKSKVYENQWQPPILKAKYMKTNFYAEFWVFWILLDLQEKLFLKHGMPVCTIRLERSRLSM